MKANILFEPISINNTTIQNRFVRSATQEYMASREGYVTDRLAKVYEDLAKGEVGLIISGFMYVHPSGKSCVGQTAIFDDKFIEKLKLIPETVHKTGSKVVAQIVHGGRQSNPKVCEGEIIAPSAVPDKKSGIEPREITPDEIVMVKDCFVDAIRRAKQAGFDGVQFHCAHGYLLSEFISPYTNRRTDQWGGTIENRARLLVQILKEAREVVGSDYPIMIKLNAVDFIDGGLEIDDSVAIAKILNDNGIDAIEVSAGMAEAEGNLIVREGIAKPEDEAYFRDYASKIKEVIDVPLILVGGMRSVEVCAEVISAGIADMVSICRPLIREPDLVKKFHRGDKTRADCISCNKCFHPRGIRCVFVEK